MSNINVLDNVKEYILENFDKKRIECLILYGSHLSSSKTKPKDYDFLLLLDTYNEKDLDLVKGLNKDQNIEFFIDYKDQIIEKGFNNYQRGRHGTYFFIALAYGKCLLGENYYLKNLDKIYYPKVKLDLFFRIEEYFYRIQKHYVNSRILDLEYIKKYISRIVFDLLLIRETIDFPNFHKIHYLDIFDEYVYEKDVFSENLDSLLKDIITHDNMKTVPSLLKFLYKEYLKDFKSLEL